MDDDASRSPGAADDDLEAFVRRNDPDRWLSSRFAADAEAREDLIALYAFDRELARIPHSVSEPLAGEIRFAWWREALAEIDAGGRVRSHPALQALGEAIRRGGMTAAELEPAIEFQAARLYPEPFADEAAVLAWLEGATAVARAAVRRLDPAADPAPTDAAAMAWALARSDVEGRIAFDPGRLDGMFEALKAKARASVRGLSPAAFPAVAHAALAARRGDRPAGLWARLRMVWTVATGRV